MKTDRQAWIVAGSIHGALLVCLIGYLAFGQHRREPDPMGDERRAVAQVAASQQAEHERPKPPQEPPPENDAPPKRSVQSEPPPSQDRALTGSGGAGGSGSAAGGSEESVSVTWPSSMDEILEICEQSGSMLVAETERDRFQQISRSPGGGFSLGRLASRSVPMSSTMRMLDIDPGAAGIGARAIGVIVPASVDRRFRELHRSSGSGVGWCRTRDGWSLQPTR